MSCATVTPEAFQIALANMPVPVTIKEALAMPIVALMVSDYGVPRGEWATTPHFFLHPKGVLTLQGYPVHQSTFNALDSMREATFGSMIRCVTRIKNQAYEVSL